MMTPRSSPTRFGLGDALGGQPQHVEGADQVDPDHLLEPVQRERAVLGQRLDGVADAGAVDVDAQRAQRLGHVERAADASLIGDIGLDEAGAIAQLANGVFAPEVDHHHLRARVQQPLGGGQAQA